MLLLFVLKNLLHLMFDVYLKTKRVIRANHVYKVRTKRIKKLKFLVIFDLWIYLKRPNTELPQIALVTQRRNKIFRGMLNVNF
jgi:hypothetical protein